MLYVSNEINVDVYKRQEVTPSSCTGRYYLGRTAQRVSLWRADLHALPDEFRRRSYWSCCSLIAICMLHSGFFCSVRRRYLVASGLMSLKRRSLICISFSSGCRSHQNVVSAPFSTASVDLLRVPTRAYTCVMRTGA